MVVAVLEALNGDLAAPVGQEVVLNEIWAEQVAVCVTWDCVLWLGCCGGLGSGRFEGGRGRDHHFSRMICERRGLAQFRGNGERFVGVTGSRSGSGREIFHFHFRFHFHLRPKTKWSPAQDEVGSGWQFRLGEAKLG